MICNLIFIKNEEIAVFRLIGEQIVPLKKDGNIFFKIEEDFWEWWKDTIDYVDGDILDFCFIWDKEAQVIFQSPFFVHNPVDSGWDTQTILSVLSFVDKSGGVYDQYGESAGNPKGNRYQTNIQLYRNNEAKKKAASVDGVEKKMGKIDMYFKKIKQQEEQQRQILLGGKRYEK